MAICTRCECVADRQVCIADQQIFRVGSAHLAQAPRTNLLQMPRGLSVHRVFVPALGPTHAANEITPYSAVEAVSCRSRKYLPPCNVHAPCADLERLAVESRPILTNH